MAKGKGGTKAARRLAEAWGQGRIDYFDAFQRMADLAVEEADLLLELVGDFTGAAALEERLPDAHAIGAACDAVVDEVMQFQIVHDTHGNGVIEGFAGPAVVKNGLAVGRHACLL